ncbi:MAG: hypothetical protein KAW12_19715 [Candidatus Aminicenantes bacterium]|nr:hypothetical protein [Candidatus Aminicenantes bacterium]
MKISVVKKLHDLKELRRGSRSAQRERGRSRELKEEIERAQEEFKRDKEEIKRTQGGDREGSGGVQER